MSMPWASILRIIAEILALIAENIPEGKAIKMVARSHGIPVKMVKHLFRAFG